jgi:hypothetical protein
VTTAACAAGVRTPARAQTPVDSSRALTAQHDTVPVGFGSLKQDEVTLAIRTGPLLVKVTPLQENVIRLLAPDTYRRLHALVESRRADLSKGSGPRELFMVSFYSYEPDVTFQPEDVQINTQGRTLRSQTIVPLTAGWGRQQMKQQETASALYVFDGPIDYQQDMTLQYGMEQTDAWRAVITRMQTERANVIARSGR